MKMCCSVNQIDDLQSRNKKWSWTFCLLCNGVIVSNMRQDLVLSYNNINNKKNQEGSIVKEMPIL